MIMRRLIWIILLLAAGASPAAAQTAQADPIQCWWRTSSGAVRVGETFSLVLTCAVVENDAARVVVDQAKLEPSVVQLAPFEVTSGSHGADLRTADRRFFQYEYRLRLIAENQFGKDVALPETKVSYHVQSRVAQGTSIEGRDRAYVLPPQSVRVVSLVPTDATDIRDTTAETFTDVDQRTFRANLLIVIGGVLFGLAGLMALLALVRLVSRYRKPSAATDRLVSDGAILRGVGRELSAVERARSDGGWTPALAARTLAAIRVAAAYAIGRKVARAAQSTVASRQAADPSQQAVRTRHSPVTSHEMPVSGPLSDEGRFVVNVGWPRPRPIAVSGSVTSQAVANAIARGAPPGRAALLEGLEEALNRFTAAQYGREASLDDAALDESLAAGVRVLRQLKIDRLWPTRRFARPRVTSEVENRAWSR
jgi:hypothetical protein